MDLSAYCVGDNVKIEMFNSQYFKGVVLEVTEDEIVIRDIKGNRVSISEKSIAFIQEVL